MDFKSVGQNIRVFRLKKKMTQEQLAEKTELSLNYIGMIERGDKIPSLETFIRILNVLEVSADMVLTDVVHGGYAVKDSLLAEKLDKLSEKDRKRIYDVIDVLVKHSLQVKP